MTLNLWRPHQRNFMEDITRWREDMNFMFQWQDTDIALATSNIKFISSS